MKLEIYFDYLCEFCEMGHRYWSELLSCHPQIEPIWMPCEAHPRTEEPYYGQHSDIAIQGMLFLAEHGGTVSQYNDFLFEAVYQHGENIEDFKVLSRYASQCGANPKAFTEALERRTYEKLQRHANFHAYGESKVKAVPTYILEDGRRLDSVLGIGVSKAQLEYFLKTAR